MVGTLVIVTKNLVDRTAALEHQVRVHTMAVAEALEALRAEVERNTSVDSSAIALIEGIAAKLDELSQRETVNPADLVALSDALRASSDSLAGAVTVNTPTP
jgi:predicted RNA-binding Zn ribbon-like protein